MRRVMKITIIYLLITIALIANPTFALAGNDDTLNEYGIEYIGDYDPTDNLRPPYGDRDWYLGDIGCADDIASGFKNEIVANSIVTGGIYYGNSNAREEHFKDSGDGGIDYSAMDAIDVGLFVGHGPHDDYNPNYNSGTGWLAFPNHADDHWLYPTSNVWGNTDMEWMLLSTCNYLANFGSTAQQNRLFNMMDGAHLILGYATVMEEFCASGTRLAKYLTGTQDGSPHTFRYSWFTTAEDFQDAGTVARMMGSTYSYSDYLPGKSGASNDPPAWPSGSYDQWDRIVQ